MKTADLGRHYLFLFEDDVTYCSRTFRGACISEACFIVDPVEPALAVTCMKQPTCIKFPLVNFQNEYFLIYLTCVNSFNIIVEIVKYTKYNSRLVYHFFY